MLTLKDIDVTLNKGGKLERAILKSLNLTVQPSEFVVVIGGNGAGKTTLMNVIAGSITPDNGQVMFEQTDVTRQSQALRSAMVAKVMQDPRVGTMEQMTIFENMAFALKRGAFRGFLPFHHSKRRALFQDRLAMLEMGLEDRLEEQVGNLSGGQRQALSLMMALSKGSSILLLDEMTAALDPRTAENLMQLANRIIREEKRTTIMITHNMAHALHYGDRTLLLNEGTFLKEFAGDAKKKITSMDLASLFG